MGAADDYREPGGEQFDDDKRVLAFAVENREAADRPKRGRTESNPIRALHSRSARIADYRATT